MSAALTPSLPRLFLIHTTGPDTPFDKPLVARYYFSKYSYKTQALSFLFPFLASLLFQLCCYLLPFSAVHSLFTGSDRGLHLCISSNMKCR